MDIHSSWIWARRHLRRFKKSCRRMQGSSSTLLGLICLVLCIIAATCNAAPSRNSPALDLNSPTEGHKHYASSNHHIQNLQKEHEEQQKQQNYPNRFDHHHHHEEEKKKHDSNAHHSGESGARLVFPGKDDPNFPDWRWPSGSWKPPGWSVRPPITTTTRRRTTSTTTSPEQAPSTTSRPTVVPVPLPTTTMASIILPVLPVEEGDQASTTDLPFPSNKIPTCDNLCKSGMGGLLCQCDILPIG